MKFGGNQFLGGVRGEIRFRIALDCAVLHERQHLFAVAAVNVFGIHALYLFDSLLHKDLRNGRGEVCLELDSGGRFRKLAVNLHSEQRLFVVGLFGFVLGFERRELFGHVRQIRFGLLQLAFRFCVPAALCDNPLQTGFLLCQFGNLGLQFGGVARLILDFANNPFDVIIGLFRAVLGDSRRGQDVVIQPAIDFARLLSNHGGFVILGHFDDSGFLLVRQSGGCAVCVQKFGS